MRDAALLAAPAPASAHAHAPAPQAPARNPSPPPPPHPYPPASTCSLDTYNSHRKLKRPRLAGARHVYRPARRRTLSRIEESSPPRARSKSLQHSTDFSSTAPFLRSRSNISADTSRSVPVCNQSHELAARRDSASPSPPHSPQYAEPRDSDSSDESAGDMSRHMPRHVPRARRASMSDAPPPVAPLLHYPEYALYRDDGRVLQHHGNYKVKKSKHTNLYLAFMY